ncbi:MAG: hypothetical protein ACFB21_11175, partial [Opitutales bacterium]
MPTEPVVFRPHMRPPAERFHNLPDLPSVGDRGGRENLIEQLVHDLTRHHRVQLHPTSKGHYSPGIHRVLYGTGHLVLQREAVTAVLS